MEVGKLEMNVKEEKNFIYITFPDGKKVKFNKGIKGIEIAASISKSLEKKSIAVKINGESKDITDTINNDATIEILTIDSESGLEIMRHTLTAQVLAKAIKNLYPGSKLAIGPTIENGFYYDVLFEKPISNEDLPKIEKEMKKIALAGSKINKKYVNKEEALKLFSNKGESYKVDIIKESSQEDNFQIYYQEYYELISFSRRSTRFCFLASRWLEVISNFIKLYEKETKRGRVFRN